MIFLGDYHTHTKNGKRLAPGYHGKGTLEDNVRAAAEMGLKEIGITDHGFNHKLFGTTRERVARLKEESLELSKKYNINILIGVEANLISVYGDIDVEPEDMNILDFVICGFHMGTKTMGFGHNMRLFWRGMIYKLLGLKNKLIERNTQIYIDMLKKNKIDILVHPNARPYTFLVDIVKVSEVAKERGTFVEINCKSMHLTKSEVDKMVEMGVKFVVDTDSHSPEKIGRFEVAERMIAEYGIPEENIANLNKVPEFINYKRNI